MATRTKARFVEPMLLLRTDELRDDADRWAYQLKLENLIGIHSIEGTGFVLKSS